MYCVGKMPDHVTRYNHKNQNRWMVMTAPPSRVSAWEVVERIALTGAFGVIVGALILVTMYVMQGVA